MGMSDAVVNPEKRKALEDRMKALGIDEKDIIEKFVRSQGGGGQKINKAATCVYLKHSPTGIEVKCQKTRSQAANRFFARRILAEKVEEIILGEKSVQAKKIARLQQQKKRRARRAKAKGLSAAQKESNVSTLENEGKNPSQD
jgi:protein subunit release factor B